MCVSVCCVSVSVSVCCVSESVSECVCEFECA